MALFGKADQNLPILTRFYQVNDYIADLLRFTKSPIVGAISTIEVKENQFLFYGQDEIVKTELYKFVISEVSKFWGRGFSDDALTRSGNIESTLNLKWCAEFHRLLVIYFDAIVSGETLARDVCDEIAVLFNTPPDYRARIPRLWNGNAFEFAENPPTQEQIEAKAYHWDLVEHRDRLPRGYDDVPAHLLRVGDNPTILSQPRTALIEALREFVGSAVIELPLIQRCEECENPYVVQRKGNRFCSHRCADREGSRRRFQAKHLTSGVVR